ncbi:MAG: DUF1015 domain-containing protein, partial [Coriobacteriales bacterium]|nr:DUF1015 domain-containing protein [Coriobacteriales bacterium]
MADVRPFVCHRPTAELAPEVAALPYDVFSREEAAHEIAQHPYSFLRIDKTTALLPREVGEYDPQVYAKAAELLLADTGSGVFVRDDQPCYYLYRLSQGSHAQTGIVAAIAIDDYLGNVLKRHENTRPVKLTDRIAHITALGAQTGPVFVTYRAQPAIDQAVDQATATPPLYDFTAPDGVQHTVWRIASATLQARIKSAFATVKALYIADGHHR